MSSNVNTAAPMVPACVFHGFEERVLPGLGDGRRDGAQLGVGVLVEACVDGDDQIGFERGDRADLNAVGEVQHGGLRAAQLALRPRPDAERLIAEPVGDGDRNDTESEQVVLLGEARADHALRWAGNLGLAEGVLDGDGSVRRHRAGLLPCAPRRDQRRPRGQCEKAAAGRGTHTPELSG